MTRQGGSVPAAGAAPPLPNPPPPGGRGQEAASPSQASGPEAAPGGQGGTPGPYDALILAVAHREFIALGPAGLRAHGKARCILNDVKAVLPADQVDGRL